MRHTLLSILVLFPLINAIADTEPNNTWQTALALPQERAVAGNQSDEDWYVITISSNETVKRILIDLTFTHDDGNIDMKLYGDDFVISDPDGIVPGSDRTFLNDADPTDHEFIDHNVTEFSPETYYILISGQNEGNGYTLTWTEISGSDDGFEVNNDNSQAKAITEGEIAFGLQADPDWYSIDVSSGSTKILASLRFYNTQFDKTIDLGLSLHEADGTKLSESNSAAGVNEAIVSDVVNPGTYHLQVSGNVNPDGYALNWAGVSPMSAEVFPAPSVNQVPSALANAVTTPQNTPYNFAITDFTYSDAEGDAPASSTLTNLSLGGGILTHSGGTPVNSGDILSMAQLATLVYSPAVDASGSPLATFDFAMNDMNLGVAAPMAINVTADATTTTDTTTAVTSSSSGALTPAWLLLVLLVGLFRRRYR